MLHLPPRPPFPRKATTRSLDEPISKKPPRGNNTSSGHKKSFSQSSILEEPPAWLDDLLSDDESDSNTRESFHSRSSSDSMTFLYDDAESLPFHTSSGIGFRSPRVFGPNSHYESRMSLPLFEHMSHENGGFDPWGDGSGSTHYFNVEQNQEKRHPRQRSRVRKLQYIAELDRTVNDLQTLVSELQHDVSTLLQQRLILSAENNELKQHASELQQQKLLLDDEYQTLREEAERLKSGLARLSYQNKVQIHMNSGVNSKASDYSWEMLDWRKLNLD